MSHDFNVSKFRRQPHDKELPSKDEIVGPKGDPVYELKQLPDTLKYAYIDEKKIYPIIISANL